MNEIYELIAKADKNSENCVLTSVSGDSTGEKAFVKDGKVIWESGHEGFFCSNTEDIAGITDSGIVEIGGRKVFAEFLTRKKKLVVCGGGHVAIPVIKLGKMLGFTVINVEDRPEFSENARDAGADEAICKPFEEGISSVEGDSDTYFVICTRGHSYDKTCLDEILKKEYAYIGSLGSRRRTKMTREALKNEGVDQQVIDSIHMPVGLNIGGVTPEEIAVSIMAEIIQVKNSRQSRSGVGYPDDVLESIVSAGENCPASEEQNIFTAMAGGKRILATIIDTKGSTPQSTGAKMIVSPLGRTAGTIGGGCSESDVIRKAMRKLKSGSDAPEVMHIDMIGNDVKDEEMICGGTIDVLLELV